MANPVSDQTRRISAIVRGYLAEKDLVVKVYNDKRVNDTRSYKFMHLNLRHVFNIQARLEAAGFTVSMVTTPPPMHGWSSGNAKRLHVSA